MITIIDKSQCSGCTACYTACPKHAISMTPDELGFKYPVVNKELCVECGLCDKVCSFTNPKLHEDSLKVLAARNIDNEEIKSSRSGAIFPALSKTIIARGGKVYGSTFDNSLKVIHESASDINSCAKFKGSKYVQSDLRDTYRNVICDLKSGVDVLFSGTPCQISGLLSIVPSSLLTGLFTVDIICHGVPSPNMFLDYKRHLEFKYNSKVSSFNFRDKSVNGWHDHRESVCFENEQRIVDNVYSELFYTNSFFRESCYCCPFASTKRVSDITLGDLWGWERIDKMLNEDDLGVSLVLVNTEKGRCLLEQSTSQLFLKEISLEQGFQRNLKEPTTKPVLRAEYIDVYIKHGIDYLIKYLFHPSLIQRLVRKTKRLF